MPLKLTNSLDGKKRFTVTVEYRMDAVDVATMVVAAKRYDINRRDPVDFARDMMKLSNKALIDLAKSELRSSGEETPSYAVGDNDLNDHVDELAKLIDQRMFQS